MTEKNNAIEKVENIAKKNKKKNKKQGKEIKKDEKIKSELAYRRERARRIAVANENKAKKKMERLKERENRKMIKEERKKSNGKSINGLITAITTLAVFSVLLITALVLSFVLPRETDTAMENLYQKSFYNTSTQVDNIDSNLSKAIVTNDKSALQKYLVDTAINSELAENEIGQLPLQDESKFYTTKLINQIGDYCKYLNNKIIDGDSVSQEERDTLIQLYNANLSLKEALQDIINGMGNDFSFSEMDGGNNIVLKNFNQLQNLSVDYPELIYDGPFSDGKDDREIKGLTGNEVDYEEAKSAFTEIFGGYGLDKVYSVGESDVIPCYNIQAEIDGDILYAQISKKGAKLLMFAYSGSCRDININREEAEVKALAFFEGLGINNMKSVWVSLSANVYTINFAYEQNGVIMYPDLIKVRICAETGTVIGLEATSYYTNHLVRELPSPVLTKAVARESVSDFIEVDTARLCVVPIGNSSEKLCYEFSGRYNDTLYFVYIDVSNGKQVEMFKVVDSEQGELLI